MKCRQFIVGVEEYLARHPGTPSRQVPLQLADHAEGCVGCRERWRVAVQSRVLLAGLRPESEPTPVPFFATRVQARIREQQTRQSASNWAGMNVAWKDLIIAGVLFASTLGSFVYNFRRVERPNVDEAIVLDVPHLNPQHPADDHVTPKPADVMLSLMNP